MIDGDRDSDWYNPLNDWLLIGLIFPYGYNECSRGQ